jgi:hypothetical protein
MVSATTVSTVHMRQNRFFHFLKRRGISAAFIRCMQTNNKDCSSMQQAMGSEEIRCRQQQAHKKKNPKVNQKQIQKQSNENEDR